MPKSIPVLSNIIGKSPERCVVVVIQIARMNKANILQKRVCPIVFIEAIEDSRMENKRLGTIRERISAPLKRYGYAEINLIHKHSPPTNRPWNMGYPDQ